MVQNHETLAMEDDSFLSPEMTFIIDDRAMQTVPKKRQEELCAMNTPEFMAEVRRRLRAAGLRK